MNNKEYAMSIVGKWLNMNQLVLVGTKTIDNHMFVKGGDYGFPHAFAYCEIDLKTNNIIKYYDANNCPIEIKDEVFE